MDDENLCVTYYGTTPTGPEDERNSLGEREPPVITSLGETADNN